MSRELPLPHDGAPALHLLGDEQFALHACSDGSRALWWNGNAINRWRAGRMPAGSDVLLRDLDRGVFQSASGQRYGADATHGETHFEPGRARFERHCDGLATSLSFAIDPRHGGELATLAIHNIGRATRRLEVVSTMELVLGDARADASHPAYAKMFVVTETRDDGRILMARRRPRSNDEPTLWAAQGCRVDGVELLAAGFETDREAILGRDRDLRDPALFDTDTTSTGRTGIVLDPVFCLRRSFALAPGACVSVSFRTLAGDDRDAVFAALEGALGQAPDDTFRAAATAASAESGSLDADTGDAAASLAGALVCTDNRWLADTDQRMRGCGGQPALWPYAISGDRPIVKVRIHDADQAMLLQQLLAAQKHWHAHQLAADLVVLHDATAAEAVHGLIEASGPAKDAGIAVFTLDDGRLDDTARDVIATAAAAVLDGGDGDLVAQAARRSPPAACVLPPVPPRVTDRAAAAPPPDPARFAHNGIGGFSADGREYVIELGAACHTPSPWVNVIANPDFGCIVTATGGGYAWAVNSQQNPITPWRNDPVSDAPGDTIYLRDVDSGALWCPTPAPVRDGLPCRVTHGIGYTRFERRAYAIETDLTLFVATDAPVRIARLRLRNRDDKPRRLDLAAFAEWSLEAIGRDGRAHTRCWRDQTSGALFARNAWRKDFADRVAFLDIGDGARAYTCDRGDFLGPRMDAGAPASLADTPAFGAREGIGLDPCAALSRRLEIAPGAELSLVVLLGQGKDDVEARALVQRYRNADIDAAFDSVRAQWEAVCNTVQVQTPDRRIDVLLNQWLPYQVLSCRVWGRTAYYQASGAFGFRDQLQDVMALCLSRPDVAREHILHSASRQFPEGDVQHWWLPPHGAGVRTRIVDDRVWLPYVAAHYVRTTGDRAVLDVEVPFLDAPALAADQVDSFTTPAVGKESASLFEHCARALEVSFATGAHGLPLFGRGDWNDGMNLVGKDGKGESVWMAWFLINAIRDFLPLAVARRDTARAESWRTHADDIARAAEQHAWDGAWWTRGWYDNGHPLGVAAASECRIDTIAQSWSVLCGAADRTRATRAMAAVDELAVRRDADLIALFTPAFDVSAEDPGYIKGYPPGLRENGGQYTHGVIWSAVAFAELGDGDKAGELLGMLNPIGHGDSAEKIVRYKVEPYVTCGDLYTADGHLGRGGWTWYSGSGGWLYRAMLEWQLGLRVEGERLRIAPCIPRDWPGFRIDLRHGTAHYAIRVENPRKVCGGIGTLELDGTAYDAAAEIPLVDDGKSHVVRVELG